MSQTKAQLIGGVGFSTADSLTVHNGLAVTGVVTATSFSGDITGDLTGNATGLTGSPNIDVTNITASGNVTIGGTLTYEDVTNVDSIGIVTARSGINITGAGMTVTGISTFRGDVQVADKIIHLDDSNTAIRFPAADTFTVETASNERFRITSSGNVGIGTESPDTVLDIRDGNYANNQDFGIQLGVPTDQWKAGYKIKSNAGGTPRVAFEAMSGNTGGTQEVLTLSGGGNVGRVGINTSTPSGPLHIYSNDSSAGGTVVIEQDGTGDAVIDFTLTGTREFVVGIDNSDGDKFKVAGTAGLGSSDRVTIDSDGNVGIATDAPDRKLHVAGDWIRVDDGYGLDTSGSTEKVKLDNGYIALTTASLERVRIDSSGNVGIGSDIPSAKLDVNGSATFAGEVSADTGAFNRSTTNTSLAILYAANDNGITFTAKGNGSYIGSSLTNINNATPTGANISLNTDGSATFNGGVTLNANLDLQDNDQILLGTGDDLQIYHDGSNSYIVDSGTGNLIMKAAGSFLLQGAGNNENIIVANQDGSVELWYDNAKKLETKLDGIDVTGEAQCDSLDVDGVANIQGVITAQAGAVAEIDTLTSASTVTPDFAASCNFTLTLGTNVLLENPSNLTAGQSGSIFLIQDGTGSRTLSFGTYWDFAGGIPPTISTVGGSVDRLDYIVRSSTSIHAVVTLAYS